MLNTSDFESVPIGETAAQASLPADVPPPPPAVPDPGADVLRQLEAQRHELGRFARIFELAPMRPEIGRARDLASMAYGKASLALRARLDSLRADERELRESEAALSSASADALSAAQAKRGSKSVLGAIKGRLRSAPDGPSVRLLAQHVERERAAVQADVLSVTAFFDEALACEAAASCERLNVTKLQVEDRLAELGAVVSQVEAAEHVVRAAGQTVAAYSSHRLMGWPDIAGEVGDANGSHPHRAQHAEMLRGDYERAGLLSRREA